MQISSQADLGTDHSMLIQHVPLVAHGIEA